VNPQIGREGTAVGRRCRVVTFACLNTRLDARRRPQNLFVTHIFTLTVCSTSSDPARPPLDVDAAWDDTIDAPNSALAGASWPAAPAPRSGADWDGAAAAAAAAEIAASAADASDDDATAVGGSPSPPGGPLSGSRRAYSQILTDGAEFLVAAETEDAGGGSTVEPLLDLSDAWVRRRDLGLGAQFAPCGLGVAPGADADSTSSAGPLLPPPPPSRFHAAPWTTVATADAFGGRPDERRGAPKMILVRLFSAEEKASLEADPGRLRSFTGRAPDLDLSCVVVVDGGSEGDGGGGPPTMTRLPVGLPPGATTPLDLADPVLRIRQWSAACDAGNDSVAITAASRCGLVCSVVESAERPHPETAVNDALVSRGATPEGRTAGVVAPRPGGRGGVGGGVGGGSNGNGDVEEEGPEEDDEGSDDGEPDVPAVDLA